MRLKGIVVTVVVVLALIFTVINWAALNVSFPLNLLLFTVQAPLGLSLVLFAVALSFLFLLLSLLRRAGQLRQITHLEHELERERSRLEKKRLGELEALERRFDERFAALAQHLSDNENRVRAAVTEHYSKLEAHERAQAERLEARMLSAHSELAADIAQVGTSIRNGQRTEAGERAAYASPPRLPSGSSHVTVTETSTGEANAKKEG